MEYAPIFLRTPALRQRALDVIAGVPLNADKPMVVKICEPTRTLEQNARMWAMLADISVQVDWHGHKLKSEEWKDVFSAALKKQKAVPGIDGGFVVVGTRTSKMTVREMAELIELMTAFAVERGVRFFEDGE